MAQIKMGEYTAIQASTFQEIFDLTKFGLLSPQRENLEQKEFKKYKVLIFSKETVKIMSF